MAMPRWSPQSPRHPPVKILPYILSTRNWISNRLFLTPTVESRSRRPRLYPTADSDPADSFLFANTDNDGPPPLATNVFPEDCL